MCARSPSRGIRKALRTLLAVLAWQLQRGSPHLLFERPLCRCSWRPPNYIELSSQPYRVCESDSLARARNMHQASSVEVTAISRNHLNMGYRWRRIVLEMRWAGNRQATTYGKPDPPQ